MFLKDCVRSVIFFPGSSSIVTGETKSFFSFAKSVSTNEPRREKTGFLQMRKQRRRSALR